MSLQTLVGPRGYYQDPTSQWVLSAHLQAVRLGQWKYRDSKTAKHEGDPVGPHLYNLHDDIGETTNLINKHPKKAQQLVRMIKDFQKQLFENTASGHSK